MITSSVYWIRAKHHSDFRTEGYIGVARNASKRWKYGLLLKEGLSDA